MIKNYKPTSVLLEILVEVKQSHYGSRQTLRVPEG